jgi:hypothetical protein
MRAREDGDEWPADQVERWPLTKLIPYARNARTHSDEQIKQIAASIREWGWTVPVLVDEQGTLIAGRSLKIRLPQSRTMTPAGCSLLKKPRLSATQACPGGQTGTSRARRFVAREGTARRARGPPVRYWDKPAPTPERDPFCTPIDRPRGRNGLKWKKFSCHLRRD